MTEILHLLVKIQKVVEICGSQSICLNDQLRHGACSRWYMGRCRWRYFKMMVMFQIYAYSDKYDIKTANHSSFWQTF